MEKGKENVLGSEEENTFRFLVLMLGMLGGCQFVFLSLSTASVSRNMLVFTSSQVKQDLMDSKGGSGGAQPFLWPEPGRIANTSTQIKRRCFSLLGPQRAVGSKRTAECQARWQAWSFCWWISGDGAGDKILTQHQLPIVQCV